MTSVEQEEGDFEHQQVGVDVQPRHDLAPQGGRRLFAIRRLLLGVAAAHPVHGHPANHNKKLVGSFDTPLAAATLMATALHHYAHIQPMATRGKKLSSSLLFVGSPIY